MIYCSVFYTHVYVGIHQCFLVPLWSECGDMCRVICCIKPVVWERMNSLAVISSNISYLIHSCFRFWCLCYALHRNLHDTSSLHILKTARLRYLSTCIIYIFWNQQIDNSLFISYLLFYLYLFTWLCFDGAVFIA